MKSIIVRSIIGLMVLFNIIFKDAVAKETLMREALNAKEKSITAIAAFTANGDLVNLSKSLHDGLDAGLTVNEIKEVVVQLYAYAGFPRSLNALNTFMQVLKERQSKGINDVAGKTASAYPAHKSKLEFGTENQTRLVGTPVKGEVYEFAPAIDQFLKEHLFGDIFGRDILDYKTREIATISALASLRGTSNQLRSHFNVGMHNGLTIEQLKEIVLIIKMKVGEIEGDNAAIVLKAVISPNEPEKKYNVANSNFVGTAYVSMLVTTDSTFNTQMASVTFEPGARTNWHYHRSGQILYITDGTAYYQERGKAKRMFSKGDVMKCPPNVHHWHGASPNSTMTHVVVSPNMELGTVVWLEKVSDEQYNKQ